MEKQSTALPKKAKKRSTSYPAFSIQEIIEATKSLKEHLGDGPYSRDSMAIALGYKGITGSSAMKIASCVHFGLLDRNGNTYSQSELANHIFNFISEEERTNSLLIAFGKPALYQKLIAEYSGKSLPLMLESILIRNYGIQENAVKSAVSTFRESAEYVGVLKNGVLTMSIEQEGELPVQPNSQAPTPSHSASTQTHSQPNGHTAAAPSGFLSVNLPSGLVVSYSQDLASAFAFGIFGKELMELDRVVTEHIQKDVTQKTPQEEEV